MIATRQDLIKKYLDYFKVKKHHHLPSASLIPENDPTVLFTTAGMHPLVPYLLGEKHPLGKRLVSVQKCIRTGDIDEVGDTTHHTFFEMLGNWSLGDYFKKEAIEFSFEFLTHILAIPKEKIAITCFIGDQDAPRDKESEQYWKEKGIPAERIAFLPKKNNWWGPAGETGPCGPDTEMFYWKPASPAPKTFNPHDENWVEIWNDVFMQYEKTKIKAIVADAVNTLIDKEKGLNKELAEIVNNTNKKIIVVTNANPQEIKSKLQNYNFEVFSLLKNPDKSNPKYFKQLLEKYNFSPHEVIYFDHKEENVKSASQNNINSMLYKSNAQIKECIDNASGNYIPLKQQNVDTGMGVERTLAVLQGYEDNYLTSIFQPLIKEIEKLSTKTYGKNKEETRGMRIIADHIRAATFIIGDNRGVKPSNIGQGYVVRRLIRRAIRYMKQLGIPPGNMPALVKKIIPLYSDYQELHTNKAFILQQLEEEETKFNKTLESGIKKFNELAKMHKQIIPGNDAFLLFQSYGFPIEMTQELAQEQGIKIDLEGYNTEFQKHQDLSRTSSAGMFKSGLADDSQATRKLHTATHLLNEALRQVLDKEIKQRGSNITPERLRFDFNFPRKLTEEEVKKIEQWVNLKIQASLSIHREEVPLADAVSSGAQHEFGGKYPEMVSVYTVIDPSESRGWSSKEFCTGPHVANTKELGSFKILKEEAVAAGIRRIKAIVA